MIISLAGWARESNIPFVLGELGSFKAPIYAEQIRQSFRSGKYK